MPRSTGAGIHGVGQVPRLLALHLVHVLDRIKIAAVGVVLSQRAFAVLAPEIGMADVVIVGNADRRPVAHHVAELQTELDPARRVLGVTIGLVAREEQQVGILRLRLSMNLGPQAGGAAGIARHVRDDDLVLVHRVAPDEALEHRLLAVPHAVGHVLRRVPFLDAEMRVPAGIEHLRFRDFDPRAVALHFQPRLPRLAGLQRKKLRRHFQHAAMLRVEREGDDLIARHIHRRRRRLALALVSALARCGHAFGPPFANRKRVEIRKLRAKRLRRLRGRQRAGRDGDHAGSCDGEFNGSASVHKSRPILPNAQPGASKCSGDCGPALTHHPGGERPNSPPEVSKSENTLLDGNPVSGRITPMSTGAKSDSVWFTTKGQVVIPMWLRKQFHIEDGTKAVVQATPEGILLKPVTSVTIRRLKGILKRKPGDKPFAAEWAEHKREEKELEEAKYARSTGSR